MKVYFHHFQEKECDSMGSSIVSSHFANRQSGKETIKNSGVLLENGETTIFDTTSDSLNGYDEEEQIGRKLGIKYYTRN